MLYLDVTSSCKSPMNTGVQRVARGLHRVLSTRTEVTPLIWDQQLGSYCILSALERSYLENPFSSGYTADAEPGRRANPIPFWSKLVRAVTHRRNRFDAGARLTAGDTFFVPEIFQDHRLAWLERLTQETPARTVALYYDAMTVRRPEIMPPGRRAGFAEYLRVLGGFDAMVTISQESADDIRQCWREGGRPDEKMPPLTLVTLPVDHGGGARPISPPRDEPGRKSVLYVATFEPRKNHLVLLDAAERIWKMGFDWELLLVGRTTAHWGEKVEEQITALQKTGRPVRWLRHVDDSTLERAYAECAFTVFPSLAEGYGIPIVESLWHGRPCVCGANGAIGEASAGGGCLHVDQANPAALAARVEALLTDQALYRRLCGEAAGRRFATWAELTDTLLPIMRSQE